MGLPLPSVHHDVRDILAQRGQCLERETREGRAREEEQVTRCVYAADV